MAGVSTGAERQIDESLVPEPSKVRRAEPGEPSKRCAGPLHRGGVYLTVESFRANRHRSDGLNGRCKDCELYAERLNVEGHRARTARWREKKRGKALEKAVPGYSSRLAAFVESGEYEGPSADEAAERLRRFERGETYKR